MIIYIISVSFPIQTANDYLIENVSSIGLIFGPKLRGRCEKYSDCGDWSKPSSLN